MNKKFINNISGANELGLAAVMIGILLVLFTPISSQVLDFLLVINFCTALMILLITFYTEKPLSFSTFPSLLLMTTLFRLALNISATRLILDDADAGRVIGAVGTQVVGGNYVIGLVVFLILIVVQFVVVTNGAQRVAEVAARFILDSLPGKQMSIDADLNMGIIDHEQAKLRRAELERESNFYGAMDGASKFVKGDAIAGIIIIIIDIIGGLTIGIVQKGMDWGEALHKYTLLTVGDGIVTQIPSLVIAVATGIIITRAATDSRLAEEITKQFSAHPKILIIAAITLFGLSLVPGIPSAPIFFAILTLGLLAWLAYKSRANINKDFEETQQSGEDSIDYNELRPKAFQLSLGPELGKYYLENPSDLEKRIQVLKNQFMKKWGIILPTLAIKTDADITPNSYSISIYGNRIAGSEIQPQKILAIPSSSSTPNIPGEPTTEPTYGLKAYWILPEHRSIAYSAKCTLVEAESVLVTHLQEACRRHASEFITRAETEKLVESCRDNLGSLIDELIPSVLTYSDVQKVLQGLVNEGVFINNLEAILEVLVDLGRHIKDPDLLVEKVRSKMCNSICGELVDDKGNLNALTLAPSLERKILQSSNQESPGVGLSPQELEMFITKAATEYEKLLGKGLNPIILCAAPIRRTIRNVLSRACPQLHVLSTNEISKQAGVTSVGVVDIANSKLEVV